MKHETDSGSEFISPTHLRYVLRYVNAAQILKSIKPSRVLDAACGTGYGSNVLGSTLDGVSVIGVDSNEEALAYATQNYTARNVNFFNRDILGKISDLGMFDAIISIETIEHFSRPNIDRYLECLTSQLISGGVFIISTPFCEESGPSPITLQHLYEFELTELTKTLQVHGLSVLNLSLDWKPGPAGRLGYAMVTCKRA